MGGFGQAGLSNDLSRGRGGGQARSQKSVILQRRRGRHRRQLPRKTIDQQAKGNTNASFYLYNKLSKD